MKKLIFTLFTVLMAQIVLATTYYVGPSGNDGNDGLSKATAFQTVQYAIEYVAANGGPVGNEVVLLEGDWGEVRISSITAAESWTSNLLIRGENMNVLLASSLWTACQHLTFRGFKFKGTLGFYRSGKNCIYEDIVGVGKTYWRIRTSNLILRRCKATDDFIESGDVMQIAADGNLPENVPTNILIEDCCFRGSSTPDGNHIDVIQTLGVKNITFRGCKITHAPTGLFMPTKVGSVPIEDLLFEDCYFADGRLYGSSSSVNWIFRNNVMDCNFNNSRPQGIDEWTGNTIRAYADNPYVTVTLPDVFENNIIGSTAQTLPPSNIINPNLVITEPSCPADEAVYVTGVDLVESAVTLSVTETAQLTANVVPSNASHTSVTWGSSNSSVASVNAYGLVTALSGGTATISVTTDEGGFTDQCVVTSIQDTEPPAVSTGLTAGTITVSSVDLSWNASTDNMGVTGYKVYTNGANPVDVSGTSTTITDLTDNTQYSFTVTAIDVGGNESAPSQALNVSTLELFGVTSSSTWQSFTESTQTGTFTATFDAIPNGSDIDAITGISNGPASSYGDLACIIRFNSSGQIDARNGGAYEATNTFNYISGLIYHFRVEIDVPSHTYSVYVTESGGQEQTVASGFAFRTEQASVSQLNTWTIYAYIGSHNVDDMAFANATDTEAPTVPIALSANEITTSSIVLNWNASTDNVGVAGYKVFTNGDNPVTTTGLSTTINGLNASTQYNFTVSAYDAAGNESAQSDPLSVTTADVLVTGVSISPTTLTIDKGQTSNLTETVSPANATNKNVTWSSNNTLVATVDATGLVTAVNEGTAIITVTTNDGGFTANCDVNVSAVATNLALNQTITVSAFQDDSYGYKPGINLVDGNVTDDARWSASGFPQWAEIDLGASYNLTEIKLYPYQDRAYQYIVEAKPDGGVYTTIVDRSLNTESADVLADNVNGMARYIKITVSGLSGNTSTWVSLSELEVYGTVPATIPVTGVSLSETTLNLDAGQIFDLDETVSPANATDKTVSWSTSNSAVATVDGFGNVTAINDGSCTITVTTNTGGFTANCDVTVTVPVTGVSVSETSLILNEGESANLDETVAPANATDNTATWSTSNSSVATVDADGVINAVAEGNAVITVSTNDGGFSATCNVTVNAIGMPVEQTLNPIADAYVRAGVYSDNNYGTENLINIKNTSSAEYLREGYLKFDLSGISTPIESAVLKLYVTGYSGNSTQTYKLISDDSWTETGITYNNRPVSTNVIGSSVVTNEGSYIEIDLQSAVEAEAGGLFSIQVTANENLITGFDSREGSNKPELVINTSNASDWVEDFSDLADGTTIDNGETAWDISTTGVNAGAIFEVLNNTFTASYLGAEAVWTSEVIEIDGETDISIDWGATGNMEATDYAKIYYILDGGAETLLAEHYDVFGRTIEQTTVNGSSIQIIVKLLNSASDELYKLFNISVTGQEGAAAKGFQNSKNNTTGIIKPNMSFSMYPNPLSQGELTVDITGLDKGAHSKLKIISITGKLIYSEVISGEYSAMKATINVDGLGKGMYFVQICQGDNSSNEKLIIR